MYQIRVFSCFELFCLAYCIVGATRSLGEHLTIDIVLAMSGGSL